MSFDCNIKAFVRKYGRQPDHLYNHESKKWRKMSNRAHRKECNQTLRVAIDWDGLLLPPFPATEGRLTI